MELLNREQNYNKIFGANPIIQINDNKLYQKLNDENTGLKHNIFNASSTQSLQKPKLQQKQSKKNA
jgi:hypothetical protein